MKSNSLRELQAIRSGRRWLAVRQDEIATIPTVSRLVPRLDGHIERIGAALADQEHLRVAALERTVATLRARNELWSFNMIPIVTVARAAAPNNPELVAEVRLPRRSGNHERVLASADAMAKAVEPKQQLFIENGLSEDFLERLVNTTNELRQLIDARGSSRAQRTGTTGTVRSELAAAKRTVRLIDSALRVAIRDTDLMREWTSAKHIRTTTAATDQPGTEDTTTITTPATLVPALDRVA